MCDSSDAYATYDDGHGFCFSCQGVTPSTDTPTGTERVDLDHGETLTSLEYLPWRGISRDTMRFYDVKSKVLEDGKPHSLIFPYSNGSEQYRLIDSKEYWTKGPINKAGLGGKERFSAGSAKAITVCEGGIDGLSVFQMLGSKYPTVWIQSATSAHRDCTIDYEYLNSFEKIYLCFDNDGPGHKATKAVASLFDYSKVHFVRLTLKDGNEYLGQGKVQEFRSVWYNSKRYLPDNVISSLSSFGDIIRADKVSAGLPFPYTCLNDKTFGLRTGEVTLVTAPEGIGKTEFIRRIEHHVLKNTEDNLATIHLEEPKARSLKGLAGLEAEKPLHIPNAELSDDEIERTLQELVKRDDRLYVYSHFGSDDPDVILGVIRFLVSACKCKYVFLDHISIIVSGSGEDDRIPLDSLSTKLRMLTDELDFALVLVSHINDDGKTRGSRNISKIANTWIDLSRDHLAKTEEDRNTTTVTLKKNRFYGITGPAGTLKFDRERFMLCDAEEVFTLPPIDAENACNPGF